MTSEGLGEIFEVDSADTCAGKFPLILMGGRAEGLACADQGARTPISVSEFFSSTWSFFTNITYLITQKQKTDEKTEVKTGNKIM